MYEDPSKPILRFAPSPNGYLHLGHAYSALVTEKIAKKLGGTWLLRIEDIDKERSRPDFIEAIYQDLNWLGLAWSKPVLRQSSRMGAYNLVVKKLEKPGLLYPCFCTRKQIRENSGTKTDPDGAPLYSGTCKNLSEREVAKNFAGEIPVQYRLHMDKAMSLTGALTFQQLPADLVSDISIVKCFPERWGDIVIVRKDIPTSYHLSVVVDDAFQNITHVTRGKDLLKATDVHRVLQSLLGLPEPIYFHHELIEDDQQKKLAKSANSRSLQEIRQSGKSGAQVRAQLGF